MKDISPEMLGKILMKANKLTYKELGPLYISASIMLATEASPLEIVNYLEEHFISSEATI